MLGSIPHQNLSFFIIYLLEDEHELSLGMLIRLRRIYNFWLFHANIIQLSYTFWQLFILFLGLTYWSSAQCQFLSVACFWFCRISISNGVQTGKNGRRFFLEYLWFLGSKINATRYPRWAWGRGARPTPPRRAPDPRGPPVRRLMLFFCRKKANIWIEIMLKFQPNRSYGSPRI